MSKRKYVILIFIIVFIIVCIFMFRYQARYRNDNCDSYSQTKYNNNVSNSKYSSFLNVSSYDGIIPGIKEGTIVQSICYVPDDNVFILSAYHKGKASSVLYIVDKESELLAKTIVLNEFNGHLGGITYYDSNLYIASDKSIYRIEYKIIKDADDMDNVSLEKVVNTPVKADYISVYNDMLVVGEYANYPLYRTDNTHKYKDYNGIALFYNLDDFKINYGVYVPDKVQGIAFLEDNILFSRSFWFLESSYLDYYSVSVEYNIINIEDNDVKIYLLDKKIRSLKMPPMSEGMCLLDNELYLVFESNGRIYSWYANNKIHNIVKIDINKL